MRKWVEILVESSTSAFKRLSLKKSTVFFGAKSFFSIAIKHVSDALAIDDEFDQTARDAAFVDSVVLSIGHDGRIVFFGPIQIESGIAKNNSAREQLGDGLRQADSAAQKTYSATLSVYKIGYRCNPLKRRI